MFAFVLAASEFWMTYYSGDFESGILVSKYLVFLIFGLFTTLTGLLAQTLLVANGHEKLYFLTNLIMLILIVIVIGLTELFGLSRGQDSQLAITILLTAFAVSPLVNIAVVIRAEQKQMIPFIFKSILVPLWLVPFPFLLLVTFLKNFMVETEVVKACLVSGVTSILLLMLAKHTKKRLTNSGSI